MSDYFWLEFADRPPRERYPAWVEGVEEWREFVSGDAVARQQLLDALVARRASLTWGAPGTELSRPRLFVSHRKDDELRAREIATLSQGEGFQVWLDVLDDDLQRTTHASTGTSADVLAIALIIEMALLNCTHVIALITPRTHGTYWVPYEYGRVKDSSPHSLRAASWIDQHVAYEPEYLELGVKTRSDDEVRHWLRAEIVEWNRAFPASLPVAPQSPPRTSGLTPEQREAIEKPFRDGPGRDLEAPERAIFRKRTPANLSGDHESMRLARDITVRPIRLTKPTDV